MDFSLVIQLNFTLFWMKLTLLCFHFQREEVNSLRKNLLDIVTSFPKKETIVPKKNNGNDFIEGIMNLNQLHQHFF